MLSISISNKIRHIASNFLRYNENINHQIFYINKATPAPGVQCSPLLYMIINITFKLNLYLMNDKIFQLFNGISKISKHHIAIRIDWKRYVLITMIFRISQIQI
jgi:hypothetical protein